MTTSVPVKTGKKQTVVRKDLLKVRVASHFSRAGATPEPTGQPASGKRDPAEQRRWGAGKPVIGATVTVQGTKASAITDKGGRATLDLGGVADGNHVLVITPDPQQTTATHLATGFTQDAFNAGPSMVFLDVPAGANFTYRPVSVPIKLAKKRLTEQPRVAANVRHARVLSGASETSLEIDLRADWIRSPNRAKRKNPQIEMIVVHHTGTTSIGTGVLDGFLTGKLSAHYVVDTDGHVVKHVNDVEVSIHAGESDWAGLPDVSGRSVGIEICHGGLTQAERTAAYPDDQIRAVLNICQNLTTRHGIQQRRIVGHEDVGTGGGKPADVIGRKGGDPGPQFPWKRLEVLGLGIRLTRTAPADKVLYGAAFAGGAAFMKESPGASVRELQTDLLAIGYSVRINGNYDAQTRAAVFAFQRHFGTLDRDRAGTPGFVFGRTDLQTAREIKQATLW
jgi:N-acetylmuramoyl-L-alanine amidase